jgi:hypothetical protein
LYNLRVKQYLFLKGAQMCNKSEKALSIGLALLVFFMAFTACSPSTTLLRSSPTPTACLTVTPGAANASGATNSAATGSSLQATGSATMPTLSAGDMATRQANMEKANPGVPALPLCPTPSATPKR